MTDLDAYKDKFSESGKRVLENALGESRRREQNFVSIEHILFALAEEENELFNATMRDLTIDPRSVRLSIEKRLENSRQHIGKGSWCHIGGHRNTADTARCHKRDRHIVIARQLAEIQSATKTVIRDPHNVAARILNPDDGWDF